MRDLSNVYDRDIADFHQAIRIDPQLADAYHGRALIWAMCPDARYHDARRAVESAIKACALTRWQRADFIETLATALAEATGSDAEIRRRSEAIERFWDEMQQICSWAST